MNQQLEGAVRCGFSFGGISIAVACMTDNMSCGCRMTCRSRGEASGWVICISGRCVRRESRNACLGHR